MSVATKKKKKKIPVRVSTIHPRDPNVPWPLVLRHPLFHCPNLLPPPLQTRRRRRSRCSNPFARVALTIARFLPVPPHLSIIILRTPPPPREHMLYLCFEHVVYTLTGRDCCVQGGGRTRANLWGIYRSNLSSRGQTCVSFLFVYTQNYHHFSITHLFTRSLMYNSTSICLVQ